LNVTRGSVDVSAKIELEGNASPVKLTYRSDFVHACDIGEPPFQGRGERGGGCFGIDTRVSGADVDTREIDLRQRRHRQEFVGNHSCEHQPNRQQRSGNRPANKWLRNTHTQQVRCWTVLKLDSPSQDWFKLCRLDGRFPGASAQEITDLI